MKNSPTLYAKKHNPSDFVLKFCIYLSAAVTTLLLIAILSYILIRGLPHVSLRFLISIYKETDPNCKGILPMLINTLYIVIITLLLAVPTGIAAAIYLTQYARQGRGIKIIRFTTEVLAGIPSILFGLFGYYVFCILFGLGNSILAGCLTMTICILPTIIRTTEEALLCVPSCYKEGAMALGAGKFRVIMGIVLPSSIAGILTAVILAAGRIVGESAALLFTTGMAYQMPSGLISHIFESGRTLTLHLYNVSKQANTQDAFEVAFATAAVLLILIFLLNMLVHLLSRRLKRN